MGLASGGGDDRDELAIKRLMDDLSELRMLDRMRHAHAPGSPDAVSAAAELERRSHELMD